MIFFTSDLHLGHKGIIEFCNRPFRDTADMQNILIRNYNSIVGQGRSDAFRDSAGNG